MGWASRLNKQGPSVFIGIPTMGVLHQRLVGLLIHLTKENRNGLTIHMVSQAIPVDYARNYLVEEFLKTPLEWLLMIDSDVVPPSNVLDLTRHGQQVVGGVCFGLIGGQVKSTIFKSAPDLPGQYVQHEYMNDPGLIKVDATGTGCLAIHRSIVLKMKRPWFEFLYHEESRKIKTGEDIRFCEKVYELGYSVYVDKGVRCSHYKDVDLDWINGAIVNYMSPEKVDALVEAELDRRVKLAEKRLESIEFQKEEELAQVS